MEDVKKVLDSGGILSWAHPLNTPDKINDDQMTILARNVAKRIEDEMDYPGQIKVNIIR